MDQSNGGVSIAGIATINAGIVNTGADVNLGNATSATTANRFDSNLVRSGDTLI